MRVLAWTWLLVSIALTAGSSNALERGKSAVVTEVTDGDTATLEDGHVVRLVGIQSPKLSLGRARVADQPLAREAKEALEELVLGRRVTLFFGGAASDRHGRHLAQLRRDDDLWIQGELLRRGLARVYSFPDNRAEVTAMLALEDEARRARRGIWRLDYFRVRDVEAAGRFIGRFELVEGKVLSTSIAKGRTYLNFGDDWRQDFTATISPRDRASFRSGRVDPLTWEGRVIRVRGWIRSLNGPMIEVTHPEQVEVLDP
jgi:endonuclease YncB( thermonuclease family)